MASLAISIVLVGCSGSLEEASTTTVERVTTTAVVSEMTTTVPNEPTTTANQPETTTTVPRIDLEFRGGEVEGPDTFQLDKDDTFDIWVLSDTTDELHVHGYDLLFDLEPGVPVHVTFVTDIVGIFEAELEDNHVHLFDIEVDG